MEIGDAVFLKSAIFRRAPAITSAFLSDQVGVEVGCISTGPERDETILIENSRLAGLL